MNRPELAQALASIEQQTYPHIEIVLVDASGKGIAPEATAALTKPVVLVGGQTPWNRPSAANVALRHARGEFLMFLDEDDWISADHVQALINEFTSHPEAVVVYSATQCTDKQGVPLQRIISVPFDADRLKRDNFIPIHAALFRASLRDAGCQFDETLDIYEDWDFWMQCSTLGAFVHLDRVSAWYRLGGASETEVTDEQQRYQRGHPIALAREKLFEKWRQRWSGADINQMLGAADQSALVRKVHDELLDVTELLRQRNAEVAQCHAEMRERDVALEDLRENLLHLQQSHKQLLHDHHVLNQAHRELDQHLRQILASFSWRAMGPYRRVKRSLDAHVINPLRQFLSARRADMTPVATTDNPIRCEILIPATDDASCADFFTLQTWAWSPHGLERIDILLDGAVCGSVPADYLERHTEHRAPTEEDARQLGHASRIDTSTLNAGPHVLGLHVRDKAGNAFSVSRQFVYADSDSTYQRWRAHASGQMAMTPKDSGADGHIHIMLMADSGMQELNATLGSLRMQTHVAWHCEILMPSGISADARDAIVGLVASLNPQQYSHSTLPDAAWGRSGTRFRIFLSAGELLEPDALVQLLAATDDSTALVTSDHDERTAQGQHCNPWFTWQWSPELLLNQNYVGGVYLLCTDVPSLARESLNSGDPAWRYRVLLHLAKHHTAELRAFKRVARVLWSVPVPATDVLQLRQQAEQQAVRDVFPQLQLPAPLHPELRRVQWPLPEEPRVSIIIPTTGKMRYLQPCLDTLRSSTAYGNVEIVVLDNSRGRNPEGIDYAAASGAIVVECDEDFNWSRLNNIGAEAATGELLLFLNDDIECIDPQWLHELVRLARLEDVGTVGCMLLYPNGAIQHGGVFLVDHGGGARHLFHRQLPGPGLYRHLDACSREVSANTGACLLIERRKFDALGRFDETLALVGNDIDLCLRSLEAGYRNVWTPHSKLIHHESVSRRNKPIGKDEKAMWKRWEKRFVGGDPYYSPALSLEREDCSLRLPDYVRANVSQAPATSEKQHGVNLVAYIRAEMGVGEASRGNAAALDASGIPFCVINYEKGNPSRMSNLVWQRKEVTSPQYDINLLHINADHTPAVMKDLGKAFFAGRYTIGFWAWELPEFPDRWSDVFGLLDEIWVPSTFVNSAIAAKSPIPVVTIPHAVSMPAHMIAALSRTQVGIPEDAFVFLSMFDRHSIAQRKNPFGSILAFQRAFAPADQSVCLAIKVNNADDEALETLRNFIGDYQNIVVIHRPFERREINGLLAIIDCYVSLHHSEGFGLGPAEAMALGKVAILTNWSGNTEYMTRNNCIAIDYDLVALEQDYGPYEKGQVWAAPDLEQAAREMRAIAGDKERAQLLGELARNTMATQFSPQSIGARMRQRLEAIRRSRLSKAQRHHS
jgi:GT2 family glycosyltransferase